MWHRFLQRRSGFAWVEILLTLALLALVLQLFPALVKQSMRALDVRKWSRAVWFGVNLLFVFILLCSRSAPGIYRTWYDWRRSIADRGTGAHRRTRESDLTDAAYEARLRRDAEWRERAKKRLPWH